ncbi:family A G protein-coupled receptor-like protein [Auriculariales sp. MPI-PUGE-AT-0066]|nr:family A G protein-coupled receptor-like protein [Auriculariales sp. MPI-PUGE-AT-0066]
MDHHNTTDGFYSYSKSSRSVAIVHGTAGVLSCVTAATLFVHLAAITIYPMISRRRHGVAAAHDGQGDSSSLKTQVSLFLMALFASDTFQSFAGMIQIRWAAMGGVQTHSAACRLQGVAFLAGDLGVCYFNVIVAVHTFVTIVLRKTISIPTTFAIIVGGFALAVLFALVGPFAIATKEKGEFYGLAGEWCFVTDAYPGPRVYLHYVPIYASVLMLVVIYVSVFWKLRQRERSSQHSGTINSQRPVENPGLRTYLNKVANKLLWYPTAYLCLVLPISIARVVQLGGKELPRAFMLVAITILILSGFVNGVIYVFTRKALSPFSSWSPQRKADLFSLRRSNTAPTYAVWVTEERQQHGPDDKSTRNSIEMGPPGLDQLRTKHDSEIWATRQAEIRAP